MIHFKTGDILNEDTEAVINTVNCVGIMGRGIALQFKKSFPENFKAYTDACKRKEVQPGRMFVFEARQMTNPRYIINFPTKRHWRGASRMEDIESGLLSLVEEIKNRNIRSIAIPPLGSGLGGLNWSQVRPRIEDALEGLDDVRIIIYEPNMTRSRAALVSLMYRYLAGLLDPFVTLLEVHKLMYFMQNAGETLRLKYEKALYGPYAKNLRHVLNEIEGHLVSGYADGGDAPGKELELVPGALEDANKFLADKIKTKERLKKVFDLVKGFESPSGLELLSTVHWVASNELPKSFDDVVTKTYEWNERKKEFSPRQISVAVGVLAKQGWIPAGLENKDDDRHHRTRP